MQDTKITLEFSDEKLKQLILLAAVGEFVINSVRTDEELIEAYKSQVQELLELADRSGIDGVGEQVDGEYFHAEEFFSQMFGLVEPYEEITFWDILIIKLFTKEYTRRFGQEEFEDLTMEEMMEKGRDLYEKIAAEIDANGLENLEFNVNI